MPFLPLMLTSTYCAVGVVASWVVFAMGTLQVRSGESDGKVKSK